MKDKKLREYLGIDEAYSGFYIYRYKGRLGLIEQIEDKIKKCFYNFSEVERKINDLIDREDAAEREQEARIRSNINNLKLENKLLRDSLKELEWRIRYLEGE